MAQTSHTNSNVVINGDLEVTGTVTFNPDDITIGDDLALVDDLTVGGDATVTGAVQGATVVATTSAAVGSGGTVLTLIKKGTVTVNLPNVVTVADAVDVAIVVTGAAVGDIVMLQPPAAALTAGLQLLQAWASATNEIKVRVYNPTLADINEASGTWNYCLIRS